jgi:hypothetical protein
VFAEVPVRVEYSLTELGQTICDPVHAIRDWAEKYAGELRAARQRSTGPTNTAAIRPTLTPASGSSDVDVLGVEVVRQRGRT